MHNDLKLAPQDGALQAHDATIRSCDSGRSLLFHATHSYDTHSYATPSQFPAGGEKERPGVNSGQYAGEGVARRQ